MPEVIPTIPDVEKRRSATRETAPAHDGDVLAAAFAALPAPVAVVDAAGRLIARNLAFSTLMAASVPPESGFDRLFELADQPAVRRMMQQARSAKATCTVMLADRREVELTASRLDRPGRRTLIVVHVAPCAAGSDAADRLASINHDLRTPLNAIMGFGEILRSDLLDQGLSDRYRGYAEDIVGAAALLLRHVEKLLRAAPEDTRAPRPAATGNVVGFSRPH
jgi:signal transduction histidine kinase